jgi:excisionase family DNA binding protein
MQMTDPKGLMTSQQFAEHAGISTSTVSKWLRSGKVKGVKQGGKWMISADQLANPAPTQPETKSAAPAAAKKSSPAINMPKPTSALHAYSIEEFSAISYLTTYGVERFLKEGRLTGTKDGSGRWVVDHANVERPEIQRLLRK